MPDESTNSAPSTVANTPAATNEVAATPRRSERLAAMAQEAQEAQQEQATDDRQDTAQDWGVSLGANSRQPVADPGWGAPSNAPDWSQAETTSNTEVASAPQSTAGDEKLSMYQRLSNSPEAQVSKTQAAASDVPYVEDVPSPDDVTIEESGLAGQAAVERILGGQLIEERSLNDTN